MQLQAIWRVGVFSDPKALNDKDSEKGFRDALIFETVSDFIWRKPIEDFLIFLSNDKTLKNEMEKRFHDYDNFHSYESISDFQSYLDLTKKDLTNRFINKILEKARIKFFDKGNYNSLYYTENIRDKLIDQFAEIFSKPPHEIDDPLEGFQGLSGKSFQKWQKINESTWFVMNPTFKELKNEREYHWESRILLAIQFRKNELFPLDFDGLGSTQGISEPSNKSSFLEFAVTWRAEVRKNYSFHYVEVIDIELRNTEFRVPTETDINWFRLNVYEE